MDIFIASWHVFDMGQQTRIAERAVRWYVHLIRSKHQLCKMKYTLIFDRTECLFIASYIFFHIFPIENLSVSSKTQESRIRTAQKGDHNKEHISEPDESQVLLVRGLLFYRGPVCLLSRPDIFFIKARCFCKMLCKMKYTLVFDGTEWLFIASYIFFLIFFQLNLWIFFIEAGCFFYRIPVHIWTALRDQVRANQGQ